MYLISSCTHYSVSFTPNPLLTPSAHANCLLSSPTWLLFVCLFCFVIYWVYLVWSECPWIWNYPLEPVRNYIPQNTLRNHSSGIFGFVSMCPKHRNKEEKGVACWAHLFPVPQVDFVTISSFSLFWFSVHAT